MMANDKPQASVHVDDAMVGANELADWLDLSVKGAEALAAAHIAVRISHGKYLLKATIKNYVNSLRKAATGRDGATGQARSTLLTIQAERARFALEVERGLWMKRDETVREINECFRYVRNAVLAAPKRLASTTPHLTRQDMVALDRDLREILTTIGEGRFAETNKYEPEG